MDDERPVEAAERLYLDVNRFDGDTVSVQKLADALHAPLT